MRTHRTVPCATLFALAFTLVPAPEAAAAQDVPLYHVTDMRDLVEEAFPGVTYPGSRSRGLNQNGDLVGEAKLDGSAQQAWVYTVEHGLVPLPPIAGWGSSVALDISDRDANGEVVIVGGGTPSVYWDLYLGEAVLWRFSTVTGSVLETRQLGVLPGESTSLAVAVNDQGQVVGFSAYSGGSGPWKYDVPSQVLAPLPFPAQPNDINNNGQICGGSYRGDLFGNFQDLGAAPETHSTRFNKINDQGMVSGRAGTSISDGAGHFLATVVRYSDAGGWVVKPPVSHLTMPGGLNGQGDFSSAAGSLYLEAQGAWFAVGELIAPEFHTYGADWIPAINDEQQIAGNMGHALLLTPLGRMVIPGDVNGDVQVDLDDYCAWLAGPIDLNDDGFVDGADELWLIDRLAVFGFVPQDCNGNGVPDHCDIMDGSSADCDGNGVPDACDPDCNFDGVPDACEPDCNGNGVPDPCDVASGASADCNENGVPDECDPGWTGEYVRSFDPPVQVLQGATVTDAMYVPHGGTIEDLDFLFDIRYRIGQLTVELTHDGVTATLIDRPGVPEFGEIGSGQLGYDIVLDDEGTGGPIEDEGNFGSPFEPITSPPSYTPNDPLSLFDGMPVGGTWTITVTTHPSWGSPVEEFNGWGLIVTSAAEHVPPCECKDLVSSYCSTTANSTGAAASIGSNNGCSVSENQLRLTAAPVPNQTGLFFYGPAQASLPFGNGTRCIDSAGGIGLQRLKPTLASDNTLTKTVDLTDPPTSKGLVMAGSTWYFQAWFRDPAAGGANFNSSDGLEITFVQ